MSGPEFRGCEVTKWFSSKYFTSKFENIFKETERNIPKKKNPLPEQQ